MKKGGGVDSTIIVSASKSGLRAAQLRIRPRPCPISGVCAKIIYLYHRQLLPVQQKPTAVVYYVLNGSYLFGKNSSNKNSF